MERGHRRRLKSEEKKDAAVGDGKRVGSLRIPTSTPFWRLCRALGNDQFAAAGAARACAAGIRRHDDGWIARDSSPQITRQGKPAHFSIEFVGKYSGFEEIDLVDFLRCAIAPSAKSPLKIPTPALLISMHTYNLLNDAPIDQR